MSKLQLFKDLVNERLAAAALEIVALYENTLAEYQEELCRSREDSTQQRTLAIDSRPEIELHGTDVLHISLPRTLQIKEELEPWTSQLQGLQSDITDSIFTSNRVKNCCDTEDLSQLPPLDQTPTVENRERDSLPTNTTEEQFKVEYNNEEDYGAPELASDFQHPSVAPAAQSLEEEERGLLLLDLESISSGSTQDKCSRPIPSPDSRPDTCARTKTSSSPWTGPIPVFQSGTESEVLSSGVAESKTAEKPYQFCTTAWQAHCFQKEDTRQKIWNIRDVLHNKAEGRRILESLDTESGINVKQRRAMTRILVSHLIETFGEYPTSSIKTQLGASVVEQFPCLKDERGQGYEAWFCPSQHNRPATGFLEDCLRNRRKRTPGRHSPYSRGAAILEARLSRNPVLPESNISDKRSTDMKEWLKNNLWPQKQVSEYMADTAIHRAQWIRSGSSKSLQEILAEYPRFLDTPGMIAQDFKILYPASSENLTASWVQMFSTRVLQVGKENRNTKSLLSGLEGATADRKGDMALKLLPLLLPATVFKVYEARKAFIDMQPAGINMPEYLCRSRARSEPFVVMIGAQAFTVIQGEALPSTTLLGAVDVCFKSFYVFNISYPRQCFPVWEFLQSAVYNIPGPESPSVRFLRSLCFQSPPIDQSV